MASSQAQTDGTGAAGFVHSSSVRPSRDQALQVSRIFRLQLMTHLMDQISHLPKQSWVDLQGLITCAEGHLAEEKNSTGFDCTSISFLGKGSCNYAYKLIFINNTQLAAIIPKQDDEDFNVQAKQSEIETMKFVRESGIYPDIPVPIIYGYDLTFSNPVGAPYILMDIVEGENLSRRKNDQGREGLDSIPPERQLVIVKALARLKASLCRPVPFTQIGSLVRQDDNTHSVGPLITLSGSCLGGPFNSAHELWKSIADHDMEHATKEWCSNAEDEVSTFILDPSCTPQTFTELYQLASALIPEFKIPKPYHHLVLHHPDIALRNVFFDTESLSTDKPKITGVIDWGGSQILPLMLSAQYPDDLITSAGQVKVLFGRPDENWHFVPADWTRMGDKTKWPSYNTDFTPYVTSNIRKFYLRAYFGVCFGREIESMRDDVALEHMTLFMDAQYYMKFHEAMSNGWKSWVKHADWIRETHSRLRALSAGSGRGRSLIVGPNVYSELGKLGNRDLRAFETTSDSEPRDDSELEVEL